MEYNYSRKHSISTNLEKDTFFLYKQEIQEYIAEHCFQVNRKELFILSTGKKSPYYFNLKKILLNPVMQKKIAFLFLQLLNEEEEYPKAIAGLTMGADPLLYSISLFSIDKKFAKQLIIPIIIRKQIKEYGSQNQLEYSGNINMQDYIIIFDDVITTGHSTIKAITALKQYHFTNIQKIYCVVDRLEYEKDIFLEHKIKIHSLFTIENFL